MKLTLFAVLSSPLLQWPILAFAETILSPDLDQALLLEHGVVVGQQEQEIEEELGVTTERTLQHLGSCPSTATQWEDKIVLEVAYAPSCLTGISGHQDVSKTNGEISQFVTIAQNAYKNLYNKMVGQNKNSNQWGIYCDPYARTVTTSSISKITRRSTSGLLAIEMTVTSTCKGCTKPKDMSIFDIPSNHPETVVLPSVNCACSSPADFLQRAPFESEFYAQLQQIIANANNNCVKSASACSYGTPFGVQWEFDLEYEGTTLSDAEKNKAAVAFMNASNRMYTATTSHCQPEYRRLEKATDFVTKRRLDVEDDVVEQNADALDRKLQRRNVSMKLSTKGTCTACAGKAHTGATANNYRMPSSAMRRQLQPLPVEVDTSNCFCPPGSTVATTPPHIASLRELFLKELGSNSVIKDMKNLREIPPPSETQTRYRKLQSYSYSSSSSSSVAYPNGTVVTTTTNTHTSTSTTIVPVTPSVCPMVTMDFSNINNPMSRYYGSQMGSRFVGGDYLYDQLWWTHGIKVSARVKNNAHKTDSNIWIPKFKRGTGWIDSKPDHVVTDHSTGGAIRLFNSYQPGYFPFNPTFSNPNCTAGQGDRDLGSPNHLCSGGGPGFSWQASPQSVYSNCVLQGLLPIIQGTNSACPDDTRLGGIMTFEFRTPIEFVEGMTFINLKQSPTPEVRVFYGNNQQILINTPTTGGNGLYRLPFATDTIKDVKRIEVTTYTFGTVSTLQYPYCTKTPIPKIFLKKYGGPSSSTACSASNVRNLGDIEYTVPVNGNWAYCYEIRVPLDSDECVYDIVLRDSAPGSGISGVGGRAITQVHERLCPGNVLYVAGPSRTYNQAPETTVMAQVEGWGMSGSKVMSQDGAGIKR